MRPFLFLLTLSLLLTGCGQLDREGQVRTSTDGKSQVIDVKEGNARIEVATQEARRNVDQFIQALQRPTPAQKDFVVKIPVTDGRNTEFMWIADVSYADGTFTGTFEDDAFDVQGNFKKGQRGTCPSGQISDWLYKDGERTVGGYTVKVLEELAAKSAQSQ